MALAVLLGGTATDVSNSELVDPAREANHRVANVLTLVASGIRLQASRAKRRETMSGDEVRLLLAGIAARIDSVGQVHKLLSKGIKETEIDLGDQISNICMALEPFASLAGPVELSWEATGHCLVSAHQIVPLALIVCETITNSIKYAHPAGAPGTIHVAVSTDAHFTNVEVIDNGVGLPEGFDPRSDGGLGFQLVRSLARQLSASLVFESDALGLRFKIILPKHTAENAS